MWTFKSLRDNIKRSQQKKKKKAFILDIDIDKNMINLYFFFFSSTSFFHMLVNETKGNQYDCFSQCRNIMHPN